MKLSPLNLFVMVLILLGAIIFFTQMSKTKNEGLDLPKCDGISGAPGSYCNPLPPCPTGTTGSSDGKNCIDNITKEIRNPDPNEPWQCPEQGMTKSKDEKGQEICTYTDPNDPRRQEVVVASTGFIDPKTGLPIESAPMEFSLLQYGLMAVVGIGMFIVILISAKNYSPTEWIILAFFFVVVVIVGWRYFFDTDISATMKNFFTKKPEVKVTVETDEAKQKEIKEKEKKTEPQPDNSPKENQEEMKYGDAQVYHVPGQYNYNDARALCRAYGGTLANIHQVDEAYEEGAEWCDYGWSEDQMALYPTQTKTWDKFNKSELHKKDCGRPGVNGGYTMDLKSLLGANCFGPKPPQLTPIQQPPLPKDPVDEEAEKFKGNLPNVSAFNYEKWDQ